jgi:2,3-bisphosphoglycerate-dependent phosphoglycerate mutase
MYKLVLLRHGESLWNKENRFTGWTDIGLSEQGIAEAIEAGKLFKKEGYSFDVAYTSYLKRAIDTTDLVLKEMDLSIPVIKDWHLNEKHYGALQGMNKSEMAQKYSEEQVMLWRRDYNTRPPEMPKDDPNNSINDPLYKDLDPKEIPSTECLGDVVLRVMPYYNSVIAKDIKEGKKVLISAHGNSLRALIQFLDNVPEEEIAVLNLPTAVPLIYELDENLKPIKHYYLGDQDAIAKKIEAVKNQGKVK